MAVASLIELARELFEHMSAANMLRPDLGRLDWYELDRNDKASLMNAVLVAQGKMEAASDDDDAT